MNSENLDFAFKSGVRDQLLGCIPSACSEKTLFYVLKEMHSPVSDEWLKAYVDGVFSVKPEPVLGKDYGIWLENQ